jgi:membrane-bound lytic murein transglycosylase F
MSKGDNFKGSAAKVTAAIRDLAVIVRRDMRRLFTPLRAVADRLQEEFTPFDYFKILTGSLLVLVLGTCSPSVSILDRIHRLGELRVATFNSATTYYLTAKGPTVGATGFEYDLAQAFADNLGVELKILVVDTPQQAIEAVQYGRAQLAAGLTITPVREQRVRFGPRMLNVTSQLIYRVGRPKPDSLEKLDAPVHVVTGSSEGERLVKLHRMHPELQWEETDETDAEGLLSQVAEGEIAYTLADSRLVATNTRYYPQLRVAFDLGDPEALAWALPKSADRPFVDAVNAFFASMQAHNELHQLVDRYFGVAENAGYVGGQTFAQQAERVLPAYRKVFEKAAAENELDWRLLAAIGYQESHWNPGAVSPTGVRGLMMLTEATADFLKVNRLDAYQSILGAGRYLRFIYGKIPADIPEPDHTWMALAAYNAGWGSLLDALAITPRWGGSPKRWVDVRKSLLLLTQERWHRHTKYGYVRGYEAVNYVANIRSYYDILVWLTSGEQLERADELPSPEVIEEKPPSKALEIENPVL